MTIQPSETIRRRRTVLLLDVAGPGLLLPLAFGGVLALFVGIPLVESLVYLALKWGDFRRSFRDAFVVNLLSTAVGFLMWFALRLDFSIWLSFGMSVIIEGAGLMLLRRRPAGKTWLAAIAANVVSYAILVLITGLQVLA